MCADALHCDKIYFDVASICSSALNHPPTNLQYRVYVPPEESLRSDQLLYELVVIAVDLVERVVVMMSGLVATVFEVSLLIAARHIPEAGMVVHMKVSVEEDRVGVGTKKVEPVQDLHAQKLAGKRFRVAWDHCMQVADTVRMVRLVLEVVHIVQEVGSRTAVAILEHTKAHWGTGPLVADVEAYPTRELRKMSTGISVVQSGPGRIVAIVVLRKPLSPDDLPHSS